MVRALLVYNTTPLANVGTDVYNGGNNTADVQGLERFTKPPKYQV